MSETATIHIDGGSRGNPGPASFAFVIAREGQPPVEACACMGKTTNNVAEYTALVRALTRAKELKLRRLRVFSDSELLVKQMNGEYRVKSEDLKSLYADAQELLDAFESVDIQHVRRELNKRADELCNLALDGGSLDAAPPPKAAKLPPGAASDAKVRDDAIACLDAALKASPPPSAELVWEQIWSILEDAGVLKKPKK